MRVLGETQAGLARQVNAHCARINHQDTKAPRFDRSEKSLLIVAYLGVTQRVSGALVVIALALRAYGATTLTIVKGNTGLTLSPRLSNCELTTSSRSLALAIVVG